MPLSQRDIQALSRLLDQALDLDAAQREAWLAGLPAHQQALVPVLQDMFARASTRGADLLPTLPSMLRLSAPAGADTEQPGERVGPYRLVRVMGRGGMGNVWLAERADGIFEREVALKLPRLPHSHRLSERMARERQIGALLEHPHIARLYDAGIDDAGRPYLVMERVQGTDLLTHCEQLRLDIAARLRLAQQVCSAVAHAHRHLVIHRDIKPSNILVDLSDQVKLLDFGIAKLVAREDEGGGGTASDDSQRVLTPRYAAPEQLAGQAVSTATDVYAFGLVLHEMLTGELPAEPGDGGPAVSLRLSADLQAVLRRALRTDPGQRYGSIGGLAEDLQRILEQRPVTASPAGPWHRGALFARRHRVPLIAATAVLALLAAGAFQMVRQNLREQTQTERAAQAREFLFDLLEDTEPAQGQSSADITGLQMLQSALQRARRSFGEQPALRGAVLTQLGIMLRRTLQSVLALEVLREANALLEKHAAPDDPMLHVAGAQLALQLLQGNGSDSAAALALAGRTLAGCTADGAACAKARAYAQVALRDAAQLRGDGEAVLHHGRLAVDAHDLAFGAGNVESALARASLAVAFRNQGRYTEAAEWLAQARGVIGATLPRAADSAYVRTMSALVQADLGQHDIALAEFASLLGHEGGGAQRAVLERLMSQSLAAQGRWQRALDAADAAWSEAQRTQDDREANLARQARARAQSGLGRHAEARDDIDAVQQHYDSIATPPDSVERLRATRIAGELALRAGDVDHARRLLAPLPARYRDSAGGEPRAPVELALALDLLGAVARREGDFDQAATLHAEAARWLASALPESHPLRLRHAVDHALVSALRDPSQPRRLLEDAVNRYLQALPADSAWRAPLEALPVRPATGASVVF